MRLCGLASLTVLLFGSVGLDSQVKEVKVNEKQLAGDGRIVGTVVNSDGESIAQADICTTLRNPHGGSTSCGSAKADDDGHFELHNVPIREIEVFAVKEDGGYRTENPGESSQKILLTAQKPLADIVLSVGLPPAELMVSAGDKVTGKPLESKISVRQGHHEFIRERSSSVTLRVRPDTDVMIQVSAPGYKTWYYIDPEDPSQPVLRLHARESRSIDAYLEPKSTP